MIQLTLGYDIFSNVSLLIDNYGLLALFLLVFAESMGVPVPGETALITAAIYAGATGRIDILAVIGITTAAAIFGDAFGYYIGRSLGLHLLLRYGRYVHLTEGRIKIGEYLFHRHGGKIVFFGRFVALLRVLAALLAGANRMPWPRFAVMNAAGGLCWASVFGFGGYWFGDRVTRVSGPAGVALLILAALSFVIGFIYFRRREHELEERAWKALPNPLPRARPVD